MPNWPLSQHALTYLINRATKLSQRALDYAESDFPLTTAQIQFAILDEAKVHTMRRLIDEGVQTIERHRSVRLAFLREKLPELRRGAVVVVNLPEWVVVGRSTSYGMSSTKFTMDDKNYLVPDFSEQRLTPDERTELVAWINRAIRQKRLHEIVTHTVPLILRDHAKTCAHLHQIWPLLTTLINNDKGLARNDKAFYETWRDRFRAPSRALKSYRPDPDVLNKYRKHIAAANIALMAGELLAPITPDSTQVQATLEHWEPVEGDRAPG